MTKHFDGQLEALHQLKGRRCPGQAECAESGRIAQFEGSGLPILTICHGNEESSPCELAPTKPPSEPLLLIDGINCALDLERLQEGGATYSYPDAFSPRQWAAIRALRTARRNEKAARDKEAEQQALIERETARLEQDRRGRSRY